MSERDYFVAKIEDLIQREMQGEAMVFSCFLTAEEAALAQNICSKRGAIFTLYGGYDQCERKVLGISSLDADVLMQAFPIVLLKIECNNVAELTNRDVLGALMATGIRREMLGDIIVRNGVAVFFAMEKIANFLISNLDSIGRHKVSLSIASSDFVVPEPNFEYSRLTAASMRADAVVGSIAHISRDQASRLIDEKKVFLNHLPLEKKIKEIHAGDCLVVRGFGKWIIDKCGDLSKKGRAILHCRKYI